MAHALIKLETLTCPSCVLKIESAVKALEGVEKESVMVGFNASKVTVIFDEDALPVSKIEEAIEKVGYLVLKTRVR